MSKPVITAREKAIVSPDDFDQAAGTDIFWIKGYSDVRREKELRRRDKGAASPMDFRLQCVPTQDLAGKPDKRKEREWRAKGYRPAKYDELVALGCDLGNSAFDKRADGSAGLNEYTVFIADKEIAKRELLRKQSRDEAMQGSARAKMEDAVEGFNRAAGLSGRAASAVISEVEAPGDD